MNNDRNKSASDRIYDIEVAIKDFKLKQISGGGNIVSYETKTSNTWDLDQTAATTGSQYYGRFGTVTAIFTSNNFPVTSVAWRAEVMIDNFKFYLSPKTDADYLVYAGFDGQGSGDINIAKRQGSININWGVNAGTRIRIKVYAVATDKGSLSVTSTFNGS